MQTGFSYDALVNGTYDLIRQGLNLDDFGESVPVQNNTRLVGTFPSNKIDATANGTTNAARSLWQFSQVFFQEFPDYMPNDNRISIWTESYGGRYGPAFTSFFQEQNIRIQNGSITNPADKYYIHLDTLGIINGCVDLGLQEESYLQMAYNNTYGIQSINETVFSKAMKDFTKAGGCRDLIVKCRNLAAQSDPDNLGNNQTVNTACSDAGDYCQNKVEGPYSQFSGTSYYDVAAPATANFPPEFYVGFLAKHWVQAALGVPLNFTDSVNSVFTAFHTIGDYARGGFLEDLSYILDQGIKVALVYGDRDYACNWIGGEAVSLGVNYSKSAEFAAAGYTDLEVNSSYVGGKVRQYGNFSFTRVYQAGHEVPAYQPQTAYEIFRRAMNNLDIATGTKSTVEQGSAPNTNLFYSTTGDRDTFGVRMKAPPPPAPTCYILSLGTTCTDEQIESVIDGSAMIENYVLQGQSTGGNGTGSLASGGSGPKKSEATARSHGGCAWPLGVAVLVVAGLW